VKGVDDFFFISHYLTLDFLSSCIINIISTDMTLNDAMSFHGSTATAQNGTSSSNVSNFTVKAGLAQMLKGGVIMDVVNAEQVYSRTCQIAITC
jgi:SOR/SNZ family